MQRCFVVPGGGISIGFSWPARGQCAGKVVLLGYWSQCFMSLGAPADKLGLEATRSRFGATDSASCSTLSLLVLQGRIL